MITNSKVYDVLKSIAMVWLPALATLYYAVASLWGIPDATNVIGTMAAVDTFLGAIIGISSLNYKPPIDGILMPGPNEMKLHLPLTQEEAASKDTVTLKVQPDTDGQHKL